MKVFITDFLNYRREAVDWILLTTKVLGLSAYVHELSIQLLDSFFCYEDYEAVPDMVVTNEYVLDRAHFAFCSAFDRLQVPTNTIEMSKRIKTCEHDSKKIAMIQYDLHLTRCKTPTRMMEMILSDWNINIATKAKLIKEASKTLIQFQLKETTTDFSSLFVAVCSLLSAFVVLNLSVKDSVIDNCFMIPHDEVVFDKCLAKFHEICALRIEELRRMGGNRSFLSSHKIFYHSTILKETRKLKLRKGDINLVKKKGGEVDLLLIKNSEYFSSSQEEDEFDGPSRRLEFW